MNEQLPIVALPTADEEGQNWRGIVETLPSDPYLQCNHVHAPRSQANGHYYRQARAKSGVDVDLCARPARIRLGGHVFCANHAGLKLLDLALCHAFERRIGDHEEHAS